MAKLIAREYDYYVLNGSLLCLVEAIAPGFRIARKTRAILQPGLRSAQRPTVSRRGEIITTSNRQCKFKNI